VLSLRGIQASITCEGGREIKGILLILPYSSPNPVRWWLLFSYSVRRRFNGAFADFFVDEFSIALDVSMRVITFYDIAGSGKPNIFPNHDGELPCLHTEVLGLV